MYNKPRLEGGIFPRVALIIWGIIGLTCIFRIFLESWLFLIPALIIPFCIYHLYRKRAWALVLLSALCVLSLLFDVFIAKRFNVILIILYLGMPFLTDLLINWDVGNIYMSDFFAGITKPFSHSGISNKRGGKAVYCMECNKILSLVNITEGSTQDELNTQLSLMVQAGLTGSIGYICKSCKSVFCHRCLENSNSTCPRCHQMSFAYLIK